MTDVELYNFARTSHNYENAKAMFKLIAASFDNNATEFLDYDVIIPKVELWLKALKVRAILYNHYSDDCPINIDNHNKYFVVDNHEFENIIDVAKAIQNKAFL